MRGSGVLRRLITRYLLFVGVVSHIAVIGVWLTRPDLVETARTRMMLRLNNDVPFIAQFITDTQYQVTWAQIQAQLPAWQPLPTPSTVTPPEPQTLRIGERVFNSVTDAVAALQTNDTLDIGAGVYNSALIIKADNVTLVGHGRVIFEQATAEGKANMVIKGNSTTIRNIECRFMNVPDGNGACIRLEGENLFLDHVYYHDGQQGVLTTPRPGFVHVRDSRFEQLGNGGQAHGIYMGKDGKLLIERSWFLASKDEGHEIKSRAAVTTIVNSVVASLSGYDSRLVDICNGGSLTIENSILAEGPPSANGDLVGFALEGSMHSLPERITIRNNVILLERQATNRLLRLGNEQVQVDVSHNLIIAEQPTDYDNNNIVFKSRQAAGLPPYPALPLERLQSL